MKKETYTEKEIEDMCKRFEELTMGNRDKKDVEGSDEVEGEVKPIKEEEEYEFKEEKFGDQLFNKEDLARFIDKNSEFYIKNKEKIENLDFLDAFDKINDRKFKIIKDNKI